MSYFDQVLSNTTISICTRSEKVFNYMIRIQEKNLKEKFCYNILCYTRIHYSFENIGKVTVIQ